MSAITAVANHLNITESLIAEIQEWASVLWVRFVSGRPRFVSKKVLKVEKPILDNVAKQLEQAKRIEGKKRHAWAIEDLKKLAESGRSQLKGDTYGKRELIQNSIEAIEQYVSQFN